MIHTVLIQAIKWEDVPETCQWCDELKHESEFSFPNEGICDECLPKVFTKEYIAKLEKGLA